MMCYVTLILMTNVEILLHYFQFLIHQYEIRDNLELLLYFWQYFLCSLGKQGQS